MSPPPGRPDPDQVVLRVRGPAAAEQVWEDYAKFQNWSRWSPQIHGVEVDAPRIATGASGRVVGPAGLRIGFEVMDVDETARRWTWRVTAAGVRLVLRHGVVAIPTGTRTDLGMSGPTPVVLAYAPIARLALRRLVSGSASPTTRPPRPRRR